MDWAALDGKPRVEPRRCALASLGAPTGAEQMAAARARLWWWWGAAALRFAPAMFASRCGPRVLPVGRPLLLARAYAGGPRPKKPRVRSSSRGRPTKRSAWSVDSTPEDRERSDKPRRPTGFGSRSGANDRGRRDYAAASSSSGRPWNWDGQTDSRGGRDRQDNRDSRGPRDSLDNKGLREDRGRRDFRDERGGRDRRDGRGGRGPQDGRDSRGPRDDRGRRDFGGPRDERGGRDSRDFQNYNNRSSRPDRGFRSAPEEPQRRSMDDDEEGLELDEDGGDRVSRVQSPRLDAPQREPRDYVERKRREIPKATPESEFVYGTSVVRAALAAKRRTFHRLYIYEGENREASSRLRDETFKKQAEQQHVEVVGTSDIGLLDSMAYSRPHNGYVLECSPLPKVPLLSLGPVARDRAYVDLQLAQHTTTNPTLVLNEQERTLRTRDSTRHPFVLLLDSIVDPGNLGALLRSAYYLGACATVLSAFNSAPLSPTVLKASSGAAEFLPIYETNSPERFVRRCADDGWRVYAAVPPFSPKSAPVKRDTFVTVADVGAVLDQTPVLLVLGSEGAGIRDSIKKLISYSVTIPKGFNTRGEVDSLNVSVAGALLCGGFLQGKRAEVVKAV